jgi:plasmid stability protein
MMATATVRNVDDKDYAALVATANENGSSISDELRILIAELARKRRGKELVAELRELREKHPIHLPEGMTSLDLLREERESW